MSLRWLPNALTAGRMVLALPLLWALVAGRAGWAFWIAIAAGLTDLLDGWLAKRYQWRSHWGGLMDPLADKVLLSVCFIGLWWSRHLPDWFVVLVVARDVIIVAGALTWWRSLGPFTATPSQLSRLNTVLQIVVVAAVLADAALAGTGLGGPATAPGRGPVPIVLVQALILACAALTVASGIDYVVRYGIRYRRALRNRK
jgi:cardiolipin synthase